MMNVVFGNLLHVTFCVARGCVVSTGNSFDDKVTRLLLIGRRSRYLVRQGLLDPSLHDK
ncbi:hypothetical protein PR003_g24934 [Phytophthora rubi]|uniref:Uncharacterized protein n=1 Tax=Phytophthora rubi TaxID=129364 RepID=A0A6A3IGY4_9STRA|nr:hypothetical protein PR002_g24102 [Phytophthora rubi]KAE8982389.1 hypothetical protein PR001_g23743 [Phytophthora rubi]KAE9291793.1 hypothetical protein PR003_g24934 [Phytophthora rubi]